MVHNYNGILFSKRSELSSHKSMQVDPKHILVSERSQSDFNSMKFWKRGTIELVKKKKKKKNPSMISEFGEGRIE